MRHDNKSFFNETVLLDDNEFHGCTFTNCEMVYRAEKPMVMNECFFKSPSWRLDGPAATTLKFMMALYQHAGPEGKQLIEATFENIRRGKTS